MCLEPAVAQQRSRFIGNRAVLNSNQTEYHAFQFLDNTILMRIDVVHIANTYGCVSVRIRFWDSLRLSTDAGTQLSVHYGISMSKKQPSKDEALEALDFIVNVLKEHEKDLDKLINELGNVTEQLGATGELSSKVEKVEDRITGLQNEISSLVSYLSTPQQGPVVTAKADFKGQTVPAMTVHGGPVLVRCKQWEDFLGLASQSDTVSFMAKDADRTFQADALKGNQVMTYSGEIPKLSSLLKVWLSKQLDIPEKKMLEGALALS